LIRVLQVIATLDRAGAEKQLVDLCCKLDRSTFQPAVCCLTRGGPFAADLRRAGVPIHLLNKRGRWDLRVIWRAIRLIREFQPHIVHTWLPTANTLGRVAALAAGGVPVLIASERSKDAWKGAARLMADRMLAKRTTRVVTNAEAVRDFLVDEIELPKEKIRVIRNGLDLAEFDAAAARGPSEALPDPEGCMVVGAVGRLERQKGMMDLLAAFALLPNDLQHAKLWIVGDGPLKPELQRQATETGMQERVRFLGARSDVPALMTRFNLFVLSSLWEGLPNVALEAMAARRAVVATKVDGTPEAVTHGWTGVLVPPSSPALLAQAIERLLRDPALRQKYGEAGRLRVEQRFGLDRMVTETQDMYRGALAEAGIRDP
jgi:glycosyltransferase involved in cell wall biosynthesis